MTASAKARETPNVVETKLFTDSNSAKTPQEMLRDLMTYVDSINLDDQSPSAPEQSASTKNQECGASSLATSDNRDDPDEFIESILDQMLSSLENYRELKRSYGG